MQLQHKAFKLKPKYVAQAQERSQMQAVGQLQQARAPVTRVTCRSTRHRSYGAKAGLGSPAAAAATAPRFRSPLQAVGLRRLEKQSFPCCSSCKVTAGWRDTEHRLLPGLEKLVGSLAQRVGTEVTQQPSLAGTSR